jgi:septal ring factor EnvC (AmiA/AmiB activator)
LSRRGPLRLACLLALATAAGLAAAQTTSPSKPPAGTGPKAGSATSKAPVKRAAPPTKPAARSGRKESAEKTKPAANAPAKAAAGAATPQRQQSLQREQRELQAELSKLKRDLATAESTRSEASRALADAERGISQTNRRLRELAAGRARVEQQIAALAQRERDVTARQGSEQRRLDDFLRQQHRVDDPSPLQRVLVGGDANQAARDALYLTYLTRDADAAVSQLQQRRVELSALREESAQKSAELSKIAEDEVANRAQLQREQAQRKQALDAVGRQIAGQKQSIARLEQDDRRLSALLDRIGAILAEQQRREADRAKRADTAPRPPASPPAIADAAPRPDQRSSAAIRPPFDGNFGQMKGRLVLPVNGTVSARFGSPRRGEGGSGPSWKGVFIRAPEGAEVRAVGEGQVVFADWLRGFGNLIVIDHGEGFLSVYGNNETLLRNTGDRVAVGEVISSVGNTGGSETPGLYFELRFQGRPFDPLTWVAAR